MLPENPFKIPLRHIDRLPLSQQAYGRWFSLFFAALFLGVAFILVSIVDNPDNPLRWLVVFPFLLLSFAFLYQGLFCTTRPSTPLIYDAPRVWQKRLQQLYTLIALSVVIFVFGVLHIANNPDAPANDLFKWGMITAVFTLFYVYCYYYYTKRLRAAGLSGKSWLTVSGGLPVTKGQSVAVVLHCAGLPAMTSDFTATLRNLREYWVYKSDVDDAATAGQRTEVITEQKQSVPVTSEETSFSIRIDPSGRITDYDYTTPTFWELEVRDKKSGYYARFFLEVK